MPGSEVEQVTPELVLVDPDLRERERAQLNEMCRRATLSEETSSNRTPSGGTRLTARSKQIAIWVALILGVLVLLALAIATGLSQVKA